MSHDQLQRLLLISMVVGLPPIALSYGLVPDVSLPFLFGIDAADVNSRNIFRAVMGLYLAMVGLWAAGAARPAMRRPAMWSLTVFTSGVGLGRLLSVLIDGVPHPLLMVYMGLEFALAAAGWWLIKTSPIAQDPQR